MREGLKHVRFLFMMSPAVDAGRNESKRSELSLVIENYAIKKIHVEMLPERMRSVPRRTEAIASLLVGLVRLGCLGTR